MTHPTVAIIMAVLNEEKHIAQAIDRLLAQDYPGQQLSSSRLARHMTARQK